LRAFNWRAKLARIKDMATFLLCWEMGGGLGHVGRLLPVARQLADRGHRVVVALCEPGHGPRFFPTSQIFTAPMVTSAQRDLIAEPSTFADILHNAGASDADALRRIVASWRAIFDEVRPDMLVLDFSPFALLAAQGYATKTVLIGSGHGCPPDVAPLPDCCPWRNSYPDRLLRTEQRVLDTLNKQLVAQGERPLQRIGEPFTRVAANWIATMAELDHYPDRPAGQHEYVGAWGDLPAEKPCWPTGDGARVFVYLKPAPLAAQVLAELERRRLPTVAFVPDADAMGLPAARGSVRVSRAPIDIGNVANECDLAILHSGHSTARFLLAGKPVLAFPLSGEQQLMALNIVRLGAGESLHPEQIELMPQVMDQLFGDERYRAAAKAFAERYAAWTPERQLRLVVDRLEEMGSR
jgi:UDP:flavonoid glycosyltransferase YjiC (YdhE family)